MNVAWSRVGAHALVGAGVVLVVLGALVMAGWLLDIGWIVRPDSGAATSFNPALGIFLFGIGLVAARYERHWAVVASGMLMVLLALATLWQYIAGVDLGIDQLFITADLTPDVPMPGRMSANAAALVLLGGGVLALGGIHDGREAGGVAAWAAGVMFLLTALMVLTGAAEAGWLGIADFKGMSRTGGVSTLVGAVGLFALAEHWRSDAPDLRMRRLSMLLFVLLAAVGVNLWQALAAVDHTRQQQATEQAAESIEWSLATHRVEQYAAFQRLVARMAQGQGRFTVDDWAADAELYLRGIPAVRSLVLVDADGRIVRLVTRNPALADDDDEFYTFDEQRAEMHARALATRQLVLSPPMEMRLGGFGFQLVMPFEWVDGPMVMIVGMAYQEVFDAMIGDAVPGYAFDIHIADMRVYDRSGDTEPPDGVQPVTFSMSAPVAPWVVRVWPMPQARLAPQGALPLAVLLLSLVSAFLVAVSFRYSAMARARLATALDVSERLRGETSISTAIWRGSRDVLCTTDRDGRFVRVSDAARVIWGYHPSELEGQPFVELVHPGDRQRTQAESIQIAAGKIVGTFVNRTLHRDGSTVFMSWSAQWSEELGVMVSIGRDVTALIEREREVAAGEERLRVAVEETQRLVYDRPRGAEHSQWVGHPEPLLGLTKTELYRISDAEYWARAHPEDRERAERAFQDALTHGGAFRIQYRWQRPDGQWRWLEDAGSVLDGRMIAVKTDITEQREAEERLERRVEQRTRELVHAHSEMEAFSYSVSHDLRTPLRAISGFTELLREQYAESLDDTGRHYLTRIETGAARMGMLIDDLLTLGQVSRRDLVRQTVDLSQMAEAVLARLRESEPSRNVETRVAAGLTAECDPRLAEVVLDNLLGNAWKFTGGNPHAVVEFDRVDGAFRVRDNGVGFDMEHVGQLFGVFQRLHAIHEFPGTGIGLATVRRIMERHGGTVWAQGEVGKGASFYFRFD